MLAAAGLSENSDSLEAVFGMLFAFVLVGLLSYLLIQRIAELMIGRTETSIREILFYTVVVALLCVLLTMIRNVQ
jgi:hypothetical protein